MSDSKLADKLPTLPAPATGKKPYSLGEGLYLVVHASGARYFAIQQRNANGNPQLTKLDDLRLPGESTARGITLHEARRAVLAHKLKTFDARAERAATSTATRRTMTFQQLRDEWLTAKVEVRAIKQDRKDRYRNATQAHFLNQKVPHLPALTWAQLEVREFGGPQWHEAYETTLRRAEAHVNKTGDKRGDSTIAWQVDQFLQGMWAYAVKMEYIRHAHAPERLKDVNAGQSVERELSVRELTHLLNVTSPTAVAKSDTMNELDACFLRLCVLTGIRQNSMRLARRSTAHAYGEDFWTFPAEDLKQTKSQKRRPRDHHIPMTALLRQELERLDRVSGDSDFLFPERRFERKAKALHRPRSDSWAKHLTSEFSAELKNTGEDSYAGHALRRTQSNKMLELGVPEHIIDKAQARVPRGTAKTYLTAEVADQVFNAFEQYHDFCAACMQGKGEEYLRAVREERTAMMRQANAQRRKLLGLKVVSAA